jgi:ABC-type bacteriocin/lantibiotic exporter with double-glycine peptidase domain
LFDEATSALDSVTEANIISSLESGMKDKTVIMVAHRQKVIDSCDHIIVMENGKIIGQGAHRELLETCPSYVSLYNSFAQTQN